MATTAAAKAGDRMKSLQRTLEDALDHAVETHFIKLFNVLMVEPDAAGFARFEIGLSNVIKVYSELQPMIANIEE
jgi:hypothetical protein